MSTVNVCFDFDRGQEVRITALRIKGTVRALTIGADRKEYKVSYWFNGVRSEVWVHADELEAL